MTGSMWTLGGLPIGALARRVWSELSEDGILGRSAQLAFYFFLSLFPLLLILLVLAGMLLGNEESLRKGLVAYLSNIAPDNAAALIDRTLERTVQASSGSKLSIGLALTFWSASSALAAVISGLNTAYEVQETRSWWRRRLVALGLTLALIVFICLAFLLLSKGPAIGQQISDYFGLGAVFGVVWRLAHWPLVVGFVLLAFNLLYLYAPNIKHWNWHWLMPGTVVGVALWLAGSFLFNLYLTHFGNYSTTYGSLGTVIILLVWLYMTGIAILVGGEMNSAIERASDKVGESDSGKARRDEKERP